MAANRDVQSLDLHHAEIVKELLPDIEKVVQKLRIQMSQEDYNSIIGKKTPREQVETLIELVKKNTQLFYDFCDTIDQMKHLHHLAEKPRQSQWSTSKSAYPDTPHDDSSSLNMPDSTKKLTEEELEQSFIAAFDKTLTDGENTDDLKDNNLQVLIQTVNSNEFYAAMMQLTDHKATKYKAHEEVCDSYGYYCVGKWGNIPIAITNTAMGQGGVHGSWYETKKALHFMPQLKYVFAVGVCGGVGSDKVSLGQVVVSSAIQGYTNLKATSGEWISRSPKLMLIDNLFHEFLKNPQNLLPFPKITPSIKPKFGVVLSGPWLIADENVKLQLLKLSKEAVAFEMEGMGIAEACVTHKKRVECLIVKGVSDLADKNKEDDWQPQAAMNAATYLREMMNKADHLFEVQKEELVNIN